MLLKEENLIYQLGCDLNLTMRIMCHAAQVKYIFLKLYDTYSKYLNLICLARYKYNKVKTGLKLCDI